MEAIQDIIETTDPKPELESFEAYEAAKVAPKVEDDKNASGSEEKPATSEKLETTEGSENQAGKPKKDRTADARFSEFTFKHKQALAQLERERDEWRQKAEAAAPKTEKAPESVAGEPDLADFVAKLGPDERYETAIARYTKAMRQYEREQERVEGEQKAQAQRSQETQAKVQTKVEAAMAKFEDFSDVMTREIPASMVASVREFMEEFDTLDALHAVLSDPAEIQRIAQLSKARQLVELGKIDDRLSKPEPKPTAPPVSKAPAPIRSLGGSGSEPNDDIFQAKSFEEYERTRERRQKRG